MTNSKGKNAKNTGISPLEVTPSSNFSASWVSIPYPSPFLEALVARLCNHMQPKANMIKPEMMPIPGAANTLVPKKGIGIAF